MQVVCGMYSIAQVQEPYTAVAHVAERFDLVQLLQITHPDGKGHSWSAWNICEAWAIKRGYLTAKVSKKALLSVGMYRKSLFEDRYFTQYQYLLCMLTGGRVPQAGRPDVYRAATSLLRFIIDGRILLSHKPPGFFSELGAAGDPNEKPEAVLRLLAEEKQNMEKELERSRVASDSEEEDNEDDTRFTPTRHNRKANLFALLGSDDE